MLICSQFILVIHVIIFSKMFKSFLCYSTELHCILVIRESKLYPVSSGHGITLIAPAILIPNSAILNIMCNGREDRIELNIRDMMGVLWACTKIKASRTNRAMLYIVYWYNLT